MASAQVILSNFYPRPLRRGRPQRSDKPQQTRDFYPRPLRRGRPTPPQEFDLPLAFLSTPSSQRATNSTHPASVTWNHFYPRPLRRGRPYDRRGNRHMGEISIHALFAEGDPTLGEAVNDAVEFLSTPSSQRATSTNPGGVGHVWVFLSTPSSQRATTSSGRCWTIPRISIHALFAEGDMWWWMASRMLTYFYPRPLRRGRPGDKQAKEARQIFLSTPSSQRATRGQASKGGKTNISIHALFAEGDRTIFFFAGKVTISIHALFAEGDAASAGRPDDIGISIHALFAEGDLRSFPRDKAGISISIHALFAEGDAKRTDPETGSFAISIHALFAEGDLYVILSSA